MHPLFMIPFILYDPVQSIVTWIGPCYNLNKFQIPCKQSVLILDVHFVTLPSLPVLSLSCFSSNFGHWISNWKLGLKPVLSSTSSGRISPFWPLAYPVAKIGTNSQAGWAECDEMNISIIEQLLLIRSFMACVRYSFRAWGGPIWLQG